jgi:putative oxidoreductase
MHLHWSSIMSSSQASPSAYGALVLRVALGLMFLSHSVVLKWMTFGLAGTAQYFASIGLPSGLAYVVVGAEIVGGTLLVLGIQSRWVALALSPILLGALGVHAPNGWVFTAAGGGFEYPLYLLVLCIVQALVGDGAYALSPSRPLGDVLAERPAVAHQI